MEKTSASLLCMLIIGLVSSTPVQQTDSDENLCEICGKSSFDERIDNGHKAVLGQIPWRVHLRVGDNICGGTIISKNWVLTAAHCIPEFKKGEEKDTKTHMTIVAGALNENSKDPKPILVDGRWMHNHLQYNHSDSVANDIALVKIPAPGFDFSNPNVAPICLPFKLRNELFQGPAIISGWGQIAGGTYPKELITSKANIAEAEECIRIFLKRNQDAGINDKKLCTTNSDTTVCHGDSGGSVDIQRDGRFYAAGINSYVFKACGETDNQGILTKVAAYLDWIEKNTEGEKFCKE